MLVSTRLVRHYLEPQHVFAPRACFAGRTLTVRVARELPLERAAEALDEVAGGHAGGKVLLVM